MQHKIRKKRIGKIEREILERLTLGDLVYGFLLSGTSTKRLRRLSRERAMERYYRKKAIERLSTLEFIRVQGGKLIITNTGKTALGSVVLENVARLKDTPWDGKWRIVFFDIPKEYNSLRDRVRFVLKKAGFVQLQQSIWVFPHDCRELAELLKEESGLSKHIMYGVLERISNEDSVKKLFKLFR